MRKDLPYVFSVPDEWYYGIRKDETKPCKAARSFSLCDKSNKKAVLLVHGYTGYPGELIRPAEDLFLQHYDVYCPRLPGHGTDHIDFEHSSYKEWLLLVENAAEDLKRKYKDVYLVGHSMGGTIVSVVLSKIEGIKKAVAVSPAYDIPFLTKKAFSLRFLSIFKKRVETAWKSDGEYKLKYEDAPKDDEYLGGEYWSYIYPKGLLSLIKLMAMARKSISHITTPLLVIEAGSDAVVSNEATDKIIAENKTIEKAVVDGATHFIFYDKVPGTEDKAVALTLSFLEK